MGTGRKSQKIAATRYWRRTRRLALVSVVAWIVLTLLLPLAAQQLEAIAVLGIPLGYYLGAQGALLGLAMLLFLTAARQRRWDRMRSETPQMDESA